MNIDNGIGASAGELKIPSAKSFNNSVKDQYIMFFKEAPVKFSIRLLLVGLFILIGLELFFRFVLPASEWPRGVILESGIRVYDSENFSNGRHTYGRYCLGHNTWSINAQGWNSIFDYHYDQDRDIPMIAILGDSYIAGFYSDVDKHIDVRLTEFFQDSVSFYTFAMAGGIVSQYIALMKYEIEQFSPDAYIVFINANDINNSIRDLGFRHPYYFQYTVDSLGSYNEIVPLAETRPLYKDILLKSSFVNYLHANAQVSLLGGGLADENANKEKPEEILYESAISLELNEAAVYLLSELNSFDRPVLIVADCPKTWIYEDLDEVFYDDVIVLLENVDNFANVSIIELSDYFERDFEINQEDFGVPNNPHWGYYTNCVVAQSIFPTVVNLLSHN